MGPTSEGRYALESSPNSGLLFVRVRHYSLVIVGIAVNLGLSRALHDSETMK